MKHALMIAIFLLGLAAGLLHEAALPAQGYELPASLTGRATERPSAGDHLTERQIAVYQDRVILDVQDAIYARFGDTNSMDPVLDAEANAIEIRPESDEDVSEGDIIAYSNACTDGATIIHRVLTKGEDQLGAYYIAKGDNNAEADPCKVRLDEITGVVVAIIY